MTPTDYQNPSKVQPTAETRAPGTSLNLDIRDFVDYIPVTFSGDAPASHSEVLKAPHARLDTPRSTSQNRSYVVKRDLTSHVFDESMHERTARKERQRQIYKDRLLDLLNRMAESDNPEYQEHASKWLPKMIGCPGRAIHCGEHGEEHSDECKSDHFEYSLCRHPLCSHSQAARSSNWGRAFAAVWDAGYVNNPVFTTFSPPNISQLENRSIRDLRKAIAALLRLKVAKPVDGAITGIEVNYNPDALEHWNLHAHMLADAGYVAHYPMSDLAVRNGKNSPVGEVATSGNRSDGRIRPFESYRRKNGSITVTKKHPGIAREFTRICNSVDSKTGELKYPTLAQPLDSDFDIDNPNHWYFVDQRRADKGSVIEVTKYITKSSTILSSADVLMTYIRATAGNRMLAVHGSFYNHFEIKGREGRVVLINMCEAPVTNKNGVVRKCGVKNSVFAAECKSCGAKLTISAELAEALYAPDDPEQGDDTPPDYSPLIDSIESVNRRYECPDPECPNPAGEKSRLGIGAPRVVLSGVFRLVSNLETGNSRVVRDA